jgi:hypothetical protein
MFTVFTYPTFRAHGRVTVDAEGFQMIASMQAADRSNGLKIAPGGFVSQRNKSMSFVVDYTMCLNAFFAQVLTAY